MLELESHILRLLLDNDCVIIPNFGGFVAHRVSAYYDDEEKAFFPPTRSIGFNPKLTMNDSLLAQSYADTYDISYPEALKRIGESVEEMKRAIETEGEHFFNGIGTITRTDDAQLDFRPCSFPVITPSYYGLAPVCIDPIEHTACEADDTMAEHEAPHADGDGGHADGHEGKSVAIRIPMTVIRQLAAVSIAIVMFVLFPSPIGNSSKTGQMRSAIDTNMLYRLMPREMTQGKPEKLSAETNPGDAKQTQPQAEQKEAAAKPVRFYTIVLASRVTKANAEAYVQQLHTKGMSEAEVCRHGRSTKVIYRHFNTKEEAAKELNRLTDNIEFSGCWVAEMTETQ